MGGNCCEENNQDQGGAQNLVRSRETHMLPHRFPSFLWH